MANAHGDFIWYELMTSDAAGARDFYGAVIGWTIDTHSNAEKDYRMISASDGPVAGLLPLTADMQAGDEAALARCEEAAFTRLAESFGSHSLFDVTMRPARGRVSR